MAKMKVGQVCKRLCVASCVALAGLVFAGCQTTGVDSGYSQVPGIETTAPAGAASGSGGQLTAAPVATSAGAVTNADLTSEIIQTGNTLLITFADLPPPPLGAFDQRVRDDGTITLIYNQVFHAVGKRTGDLEKEIHDFYVPRYFINLTVTVRISTDRSYYVEGEVKVPSKYPYTTAITVSKAIAAAGGFTDFANKTKIQLIRPNRPKQIINYNKLLDHPELDPQVFPEDRIHVKRRIF